MQTYGTPRGTGNHESARPNRIARFTGPPARGRGAAGAGAPSPALRRRDWPVLRARGARRRSRGVRVFLVLEDLDSPRRVSGLHEALPGVAERLGERIGAHGGGGPPPATGAGTTGRPGPGRATREPSPGRWKSARARARDPARGRRGRARCTGRRAPASRT